MSALLEQLIADFHERPLPTPTHREAELPALSGKIDAIIGMRRTGKTWFLFQTMQHYLEQGIPKQAMLYVNFDDERLLPMMAAELGQIIDTYYRMFPEHRDRTCYFFFDEVQNISGWEVWLRRLVDTERVQIAVTGSSAKLLSREIATALRGRSLSTEMFPFSFREALAHEEIEGSSAPRPGARKRALLENRLRRYLLNGGFPEVQTVSDNHRIRILQEYVDVVILRDIVERYQVSNILPLRTLIRHLLATPATLFSVNKFYNDLRSQGLACGKNTLHDYFEYLKDAYLIYPVSIHSRSERTRRVNPRKVYVIDTGLANAFLHRPQSDWGRLLENFVFMELRRKGLAIEYYRTGNGLEVDFIATDHRDARTLYQASLELRDVQTRKREVRALTTAMQETGITGATIVSLDTEERIETDAGVINVVPAWLWALQ
ncbi:MAG TPA: ATP-binding protein [Gammaproteobacteria bacterium]|nr:ATP-binding protein [Gammaproteobacteria bacterium]